jgi:hypothetical protein
MSQLTLYNALTGASCSVDAGDGHRQKAWLDEIPRWLKESVEPAVLKGLGLGRLVNFPSFLDGRGLSSNPIGQAPVIGTFNGVEVTRVVPQTAVLTLGDGAVTDFGGEALTTADRTHANYFNTTTDPDDPVAPRGATGPAFLQTLADGGGFDLHLTSGILTLRVNGVLFTVTGLTGTTETAELIRDAITAAGVPVDCQVEGGDTLRIFAPGNGVTANIEAVAVAGDVATALFTGASQSSQPNVLYTGTNGPLGVMDNLEVVGGVKPQKRILPGSVVVTATVGAATVTITDDGAGVLSDVGGTNTGTINYATGAIDLNYATAPDNATNVTVTWKALKELKLHEPVRVPSSGMELALRLL